MRLEHVTNSHRDKSFRANDADSRFCQFAIIAVELETTTRYGTKLSISLMGDVGSKFPWLHEVFFARFEHHQLDHLEQCGLRPSQEAILLSWAKNEVNFVETSQKILQ
jgi:hypothetical protein